MRVNRSSKDKNFNTRMTIFPMKHQTSSCNVYVQIEHQNRMIGTLTFLCTSNLDQLYRLNMFEWNIKWEWFVEGRLNIYTNTHLNMLERNIKWEWFVVVYLMNRSNTHLNMFEGNIKSGHLLQYILWIVRTLTWICSNGTSNENDSL
jgi:hypothetical protein